MHGTDHGIHLTAAQEQAIRNLCGGKFNFVIIGPSQHGKTTFLSQVLGVDPSLNGDATIGLGLESATLRPHIRQVRSELSQVHIQFIDTPGLCDSRSRDSDAVIKSTILDFLKTNKPNCVMFFYRFFHAMTEELHRPLNFARQIAQQYNCPILMVHTFSDGAVNLSSYPSAFVDRVCNSVPQLAEEEDEAQIVQHCFTQWKEAREERMRALLSDTIVYSCCYGFKRRGRLELPDGSNPANSVVQLLRNVLGDTILLLMELAKDEEVRKAGEQAFMDALGLGGLAISVAVLLGMLFSK